MLYQLHPPPNLHPKRGRLSICYHPVPLPSLGEGVRGWGEVDLLEIIIFISFCFCPVPLPSSGEGVRGWGEVDFK